MTNQSLRKCNQSKQARFRPQQADKLRSFSCGDFDFRIRENTRGKGWWSLHPRLKEAAKARHVTGGSLSGGQERPLCEVVKLGLC